MFSTLSCAMRGLTVSRQARVMSEGESVIALAFRELDGVSVIQMRIIINKI